MEDKKEKSLADKYSLMSTKDLLGEIEKWNANTESAAKKREKVQQDARKNFISLNQIETNYILKKRNVKSIDDLTGPLGLDKKNRKQEATELLNTVLLDSIKKEYGSDAAKLYQKNPEMLQGYAVSKNIDWHKTRQELMDNYKDISKAETYDRLKQTLAQGSIKELKHMNQIRSEIVRDTSHHKETKKRTNSLFQKKHKKTLEETLDIQDFLSHYSEGLKGNVNEDYLREGVYETHFKPYQDKSK